MIYQVQIIEAITETRDIEVEADTPQQAHRLAYEQWVENGGGDEPSIAVNDRTFVIEGPDGSSYEGDDDNFDEDEV